MASNDNHQSMNLIVAEHLSLMKIVQAAPPEVSTDDVVDEIHDVVMEDRAESRRGKFISYIVKISTERVYNILQWFGCEEVVCKIGPSFSDGVYQKRIRVTEVFVEA